MAKEKPPGPPPKAVPVGEAAEATPLPLMPVDPGFMGMQNPLMALWLANQGLQGPVQLMQGGRAMGGAIPYLPGLSAPGVVPMSTLPSLLSGKQQRLGSGGIGQFSGNIVQRIEEWKQRLMARRSGGNNPEASNTG